MKHQLKKKIFFSVIIPTYNVEKFIDISISSVLNQTYKNYEIIIIDNYSKDKTESIVKKYKNKKIKFFKIKNYGVIGRSRNYGLKKSIGNWIAFLDADDYWFSNRLEKINKLIKKKNFDVVCSSELIIDEINSKNKIWHYGYNKSDFYKFSLEYGGRISTSASIVSKKFLDRLNLFFSEKKIFASFEDYDFFLNIARLGGKFYFYRKVLGKHLFHNDSTTMKQNKLAENFFAVVDKHIKLNKKIKNKFKFIERIKYFYSLRTIISEIFYKKFFFLNIVKLAFKFFSKPILFVQYIFLLIKIQKNNVKRID